MNGAIFGSSIRRFAVLAVVPCVLALIQPGCGDPAGRADLQVQLQKFEDERKELLREIEARDAAIAALEMQIDSLKSWPEDRPADLFAPVAVEIASRSGGIDTGGSPGDDAVRVYVKLRDGDGDAVKYPGRFVVQILDNTDAAQPDVLAVCEFASPTALRDNWYSLLGTYHYAFTCPLKDGKRFPDSRQVTAAVRMTDYLTARTLEAVDVLKVAFPSGGGGSARAEAGE